MGVDGKCRLLLETIKNAEEEWEASRLTAVLRPGGKSQYLCVYNTLAYGRLRNQAARLHGVPQDRMEKEGPSVRLWLPSYVDED